MESLQKKVEDLLFEAGRIAIEIANLQREIQKEKNSDVFKKFQEAITQSQPFFKVDEAFVRKHVEDARQVFVTDMLAASAKFKERTGLKIIVTYKVDEFIKL